MSRRPAKLAIIAWVAALGTLTAFFLWLWIASYTATPKRLYHSTDRYCSWIGFQNGRFISWYDGGPDVRTFARRDFRFLGIFVSAKGGTSWQYFAAGVHGAYACGWLIVLWTPTAWFLVLRPRLRGRRGRCAGCGYDLRGIPSGGPCPECGAMSPPPAPGHDAASRERKPSCRGADSTPASGSRHADSIQPPPSTVSPS